MNLRNGIIGLVVAGTLVLVGAIYTIGGLTHIPIGSVGIVKHMNGQVTELGQGWHWTGWTVSVQEYPTFQQSLVLNADKEWQIGTSDQQELPVDTSLTWKIDTKNATSLYQAIGGKDITYIDESIVLPTLKNIVNQITHKYDWNSIKGSKQSDITKEINDALKVELAKSGIDVGTFGFTHVGSPKGMDQAQSTLAQAELGKQKALADQQKAQIENETKISNAKAQAEADKAQAEGTKAQASAINEFVIQKAWIDKWDGKQSQVSGVQNGLLNIPVGK